MYLQKVLENLGYKSTEVKVYLAALELGTCTISELAQKVGIPRTSAQATIVGLKKAGLITPITQQNHKYWIAENPSKFMTMLKEHETALAAAMPDLQALRADTENKPTIRTFAGKEEITKVYDDILETRKHMLAIISWSDWVEMLGKDFVDQFIEQRHRHFLKVRMLTPRTPIAVELKKKDNQELRTTSFLPPDITIQNTNFIYGDKVAIISLNKKFPVGIVIEDPSIRATMETFFELLWQKSSQL